MPGLAEVIPARGLFIPAFAKSSSSSLQLSFSSVPQELFHLPWKDLKLGEGLVWLLAQEKVFWGGGAGPPSKQSQPLDTVLLKRREARV